jgi:aminoglycoside phosphotransferase (APT) family kinase protein
MELLPHGHTNRTSRSGDTVNKAYRGPDAVLRRTREVTAVTALHGRVPVPRFVEGGVRDATFTFVAGVHAQDMLRPDTARRILRSCGEVLRSIHAVDPAVVVPGGGQTLVHGDYGPNNVLVDPRTLAVTAVVDWEWAHDGDGLEDLAWCEWIVRAYDEQHRDALDEFFDAYGRRPAWEERHRTMIEKCREQVTFWESWPGQSARAEFRRQQLSATEGWTE